MLARLKPLVTRDCPFTPKPKVKNVTWVKPELVCEIRFHEWTGDHMLRAPVFLGLREDKAPAEVVREEPPAEPVKASRKSVRRSRKTTESAPTLDLTGKEAVAEVDGRTLKFTNLDKVLYPKDGFTKRDSDSILRSGFRVAPSAFERPAALAQAVSERH